MSEVVNASPTVSPAAQTASLDCQPILERKGADIWSHAAAACNELYKSLQRACENEGVNALVLKSEPFVYPVWVKFECWVPKQGRTLTERASGVVTIIPKNGHSKVWAPAAI